MTSTLFEALKRLDVSRKTDSVSDNKAAKTAA